MKLFVALSLLATACSGPSPSPKAPAEPSDQAGRSQRLQIGSLEAYALVDGHIDIPNDGKMLGVDHSPSEIAELLKSAGLPTETIRLDIQCLLVKAGDRVILFDTGLGALGGTQFPTTGLLPLSLTQAGAQPDAVTDIFITHAHSDHMGGLVTKDGALAFQAATIHMSVPEWDALQAESDQDAKRLVDTIAPKLTAFEPGAQVLPVVKAVATHGHTVGHSSYEVGAESEKLFYLGDLAHHSIISVQRPTWSIQVDGEGSVAETLRQEMLGKLAAAHTRVFAPHFPFPGVGQVAAEGQGFVWKPESR